MLKIPKLVITSLGQWSYFEWFILGFQQLDEKGEISFEFKLPFHLYLLTVFKNVCVLKVLAKCLRKFCKSSFSYNLDGYVEYCKDGRSIRRVFTIDCADSPFSYDCQKLRDAIIYFKMQCPKDLESEKFKISQSVYIPWVDHNRHSRSSDIVNFQQVFKQNRYKIRPLMIGPRELAPGLNYQLLNNSYKDMLKSRRVEKVKRFMCYFGSSKGPIPLKTNKEIPDFNSESEILGSFETLVEHPNEKRAIVCSILKKFEGSDARIIRNGNSDTSLNTLNDKPIPLREFSSHVANFEYNFNVSGYRLSIPNRFIDSFMVGTCVVTDKLSVKWYLPFSRNEVIETIPMGYERLKDVDFSKFEGMVEELPQTKPEKIIEEFEKKWKPESAARYIVRSILEATETFSSSET